MARVGMNLALYTVLRLRPDFRCASDNMAEEGEEIPSLVRPSKHELVLCKQL